MSWIHLCIGYEKKIHVPFCHGQVYILYIYMSGIHFFQTIKNRYRDILSCHGYIYVQDMKSKSMCHLNFHFAKVEYKNIYI